MEVFIILVMMGLVILGTITPIIVAAKRKSPHMVAVVLIVWFLSFTIIGWWVALYLALQRPQPMVVTIAQRQPFFKDGQWWTQTPDGRWLRQVNGEWV